TASTPSKIRYGSPDAPCTRPPSMSWRPPGSRSRPVDDGAPAPPGPRPHVHLCSVRLDHDGAVAIRPDHADASPLEPCHDVGRRMAERVVTSGTDDGEPRAVAIEERRAR